MFTFEEEEHMRRAIRLGARDGRWRRSVEVSVLLVTMGVAGAEAVRSLNPWRSETVATQGYAAELSRLDSKVRWHDQSAASQRSTSWMAQADAAAAHTERARLTGNYDDYAAAEELLGQAFRIAPPGAGPYLERASLNFTLHRFSNIEADLAAMEGAVVVDNPTRAALCGLRADVALQRGQIESSRRGFETALELQPSPTAWARLAQWYWTTGEHAAAAGAFRQAAAMNHDPRGSQKAWTHLQLGLMDLGVGNLAGALAHYRDADAVFPGWWLVEEHIAEVLALQGRKEVAMRMVRDLIRRTQNPEFMDALARLLRAEGKAREAERWQLAARTIYEQRLAQFPEATWGHALRHYLEFGPYDVAVDLAEKNWNLRPNREARELLERAYEKTGGRAVLDQGRPRLEAMDTTEAR